MTSFAFGRPTIIPRDAPVPLLAAIDDEYLSTTIQGRQPENVPSRLDFFIYTLKLLGIREKFQSFELSRDDSQHITTHMGRDLGDMLDLITELDTFCQELPLHLQTSGNVTSIKSDSCFELQSRVLKTR